LITYYHISLLPNWTYSLSGLTGAVSRDFSCLVSFIIAPIYIHRKDFSCWCVNITSMCCGEPSCSPPRVPAYTRSVHMYIPPIYTRM
jgi:hypothetical protein